MPDPLILFRAILTLAAAVVAGGLLDSAGMPLGWLVGAMLAMIAASLMRLPAVQPTRVLPFVKGAVGTMLGASIPAGLATPLRIGGHRFSACSRSCCWAAG